MERIGYSPYLADNEIGLEKGKTVTDSILKRHMLQRQKDYNERIKRRLTCIGEENFGAYAPIIFKQNNSPIERIIKFLNYYI